MANPTTTELEIELPEPGASDDEWAELLNAAFEDRLDAMLSGGEALPGLDVGGDAAVDGSLTGPTITDHDGRIEDNETDIAAHDGRIGDNETDIADHETRITQNESDIDDLETDGALPDGWASVADEGATGDGTTDDTTAIQAAIDSLSDGDTLIFPPGTYSTDGLTVTGLSDIHILGYGATLLFNTLERLEITGSDRITAVGLTFTNDFEDGSLTYIDTSTNITFRDAVWKENGAATTPDDRNNGVVHETGATSSDNIRYIDCDFIDIGGRALMFRDVETSIVHGCHFVDWHQREESAKWDDNDGCIDYYGPDMNAIVSNNTFEMLTNPSTERTQAINTQGNKRILITGNTALFAADDNAQSNGNYEPRFVRTGERDATIGEQVIVTNNIIEVTGFLDEVTRCQGTHQLTWADNMIRVKGTGEIDGQAYRIRAASAARDTVHIIGDQFEMNGLAVQAITLDNDIDCDSIIISNITARDVDFRVIDAQSPLSSIGYLLIEGCYLQSTSTTEPVIHLTQDGSDGYHVIRNCYLEGVDSTIEDNTGSSVAVSVESTVEIVDGTEIAAPGGFNLSHIDTIESDGAEVIIDLSANPLDGDYIVFDGLIQGDDDVLCELLDDTDTNSYGDYGYDMSDGTGSSTDSSWLIYDGNSSGNAYGRLEIGRQVGRPKLNAVSFSVGRWGRGDSIVRGGVQNSDSVSKIRFFPGGSGTFVQVFGELYRSGALPTP